MATHRYWRLKVSANGGGAYVAINEIELRTAADGSGSNLSITGNGTATAQTEYSASYIAAYAFDANSANRWNSGNAAGLPQWVKWDFGAGNAQDINHLTIKNTSQEPTNCHVLTANLEYSDDDVAWTAWIPVISHPSTVSASGTYTRSLYTVAASMPTPTVAMRGGDRADVAMPMPTLDIRSGMEAAVAMPMPTLVIRDGDTTSVSMPMPTIDFVIVRGVENAWEVAMPMPTVEAKAGLRTSAAMPMPTVAFTGTTTILMEVEAVMPMPTAAMQVTKTESLLVTATMPMPTASAKGGARAAAAMSMPSVLASGKTGSVISFGVTMPMPDASLSMTAQAFMAIEAVMPMLVAGPYGRITAMMPMAQVDMRGHTVVAVTYEAYAVNLKPGEKMPHQVTRYTDFPFNQIVRYQGRYIAVADDGLYELGGATDYDPVTPAGPAWSWETGITDFRSSQIKQVREAIVGGRLGPSVTASVSVGEAADRTYAGTIVRGSSAQNYRVKYGRGLDGRYWSFGLADAAGGECDIDMLEFDVTEQGRKI